MGLAIATVRDIRPIPPVRRVSVRLLDRNQSDVISADLPVLNAPGQAWQQPSGLTLLVDSMHKTRTGEVAEWLKAALC